MPSQQDLTLATLFKAVEDGSFRKVVRRLTMLLNGLNTAFNQTNKAAERVEKATKKAGDALDKMGRKTEKAKEKVDTFTGTVNRLTRAFKTGATYFIAYRLFHAITQGAKEGVAEIINFDQALHNLAAISDASTGELALMRDVIIDTADRTKYSTTEIAEGMVLLTQAGLSAAEATQAIGAVADLAAGTLSNLATTSDLVTTALRAFDIGAHETRRVADVMANAINKSKLTVDKLRIAFNYIGAGAHQAGLSLEQTAASAMMLANAGARASTIGTGMRQVLSRLLSPNKKLREAMALYGLEIDKSTGKNDWFSNQIEKLAAVMYDFETNTVDMSKAYELFGLRGAQAASILISNYTDLNGIWDKTYEYANRIGTAQEMMSKQAEGLAFKIKNLADKLKNLAIVLGEGGFTTLLKMVVDILRGTTWAFTQLANTLVGKVIFNTLALTAGIFGLVGVLKLLKALLIPVITALGGLSLATLGVIGTIALLIGSFGALIAHQKKITVEASKIAAANKALVDSFYSYRNQLGKVVEGSDEYYQIIDRLKQEHPEYAKEIDKVKDSYQELSKVMDEIAKKKTEESLKKVTENFGDQINDINYMLFLYSEYRKSTKENIKTFEDWAKAQKGLTRSQLEGVQNIITAYGDLLNKLYKEEGWDAVEKKLKSLMATEKIHVDNFFGAVNVHGWMIEKIKNQLKDNEKAEEEAAKRRERIQLAQLDKLKETIPNAWKSIFEKLSSLEKLKFLGTLDKTNKEWKEKEKLADLMLRSMYKNEEEFEKEKARMKKEFYAKALSEFEKNIVKQRNLITTFPDEWKKVFDKLSDYEKIRFVESYNNAISGWKKQLKVAQQIVKDRKLTIEEGEKFIAKTRAEYMKKELNEFFRKEDAKLYKVKEIYQKINEKSARYTEGKYATEAAKAETFYKQMEQRIDQLEIYEKEKDEIRLRNKEVYYERLERIARIHGFGSEKEREEFEETTGITANETYGVTSIDELSKKWKESGKNVEIYIAQLKVLRDEGKITAEEYERAMERTFSKPGEAFANGWENAMEKVRNASEFLYDLAEDLPERLADGFTNAWEEFLDGTKSASEAFEDFARDVLKWIARMITKWLILKAMKSVMGESVVAHKGGIIGKDVFPKRAISSALFNFAPRLHNGINNKLKKNEYPAILQKEEGVFTKGQMKALGAAGGTSINVPVNIADSEKGEFLKRHLPSAIEEAVLRTMRKYVR